MSSLDSLAHQQQRNYPTPVPVQAARSRRDEFYKFLSNVMNARGTPLPPSITGLPSPYDPMNTRWASLEPSSEPGGFKFNGKDIELFKLWHLVMPNGGHGKVRKQSPHFSPERAPHLTPSPTTHTHTAQQPEWMGHDFITSWNARRSNERGSCSLTRPAF